MRPGPSSGYRSGSSHKTGNSRFTRKLNGPKRIKIKWVLVNGPLIWIPAFPKHRTGIGRNSSELPLWRSKPFKSQILVPRETWPYCSKRQKIRPGPPKEILRPQWRKTQTWQEAPRRPWLGALSSISRWTGCRFRGPRLNGLQQYGLVSLRGHRPGPRGANRAPGPSLVEVELSEGPQPGRLNGGGVVRPASSVVVVGDKLECRCCGPAWVGGPEMPSPSDALARPMCRVLCGVLETSRSWPERAGRLSAAAACGFSAWRMRSDVAFFANSRTNDAAEGGPAW